jgi:hypothetical protein
MREHVREMHEGKEWSSLVSACQSVRSYENICDEIFLDGDISFGRLFVLKIYTEEVYRLHPHMACHIKSVYRKYCRRIDI